MNPTAPSFVPKAMSAYVPAGSGQSDKQQQPSIKPEAKESATQSSPTKVKYSAHEMENLLKLQGNSSLQLPQRKRQIHWGSLVKVGSLAGQSRINQNKNGKFVVDEKYADEYGERRVFCGALSLLYLMHPHFVDMATDPKAEHVRELVAQMGGLQPLLEIERNLRLQDRKTRQVVSNKQFGAYITDVIKKMGADGRDEARIFLSTSAHALALKIRKKTDENGIEKFVVSCYDPVITSNHAKVQSRTIDVESDLSKFSLQNFFVHLQHYVMPGLSPSAACMTAASLDGIELSPPEEMKYLDADADGNEIVTAALQNNLPELLQAYGHALKVAGIVEDAALGAMQGKRKDGVPAIVGAAEKGDCRTLECYGEVLAQLGITGQKAIDLMFARRPPPRDTPLTYIMAENKGGEFLKAYGQVLKKLGITGPMAVPLLLGQHTDGTTALCQAAIKKDTEFLKAYGLVLKELGITAEMAAPLMGGKEGKYGLPPILIAMANGDNTFLKNYGTVLHYLGVTEHLAAPLIGGSDANGNTAHSVAKQMGRDDFITSLKQMELDLGVASEMRQQSSST